MAITYEWDVELLEEFPSAENNRDPDIKDHRFFDQSFADAKAYYGEAVANREPARIVLVRHAGNDVEGETDRAWAYLENGALPKTFTYGADEDSGIKVPNTFRLEVERWGRNVRNFAVVGAVVAFNKLDDAAWFDVVEVDGMIISVREHGTNYRAQTIYKSLVAQNR